MTERWAYAAIALLLIWIGTALTEANRPTHTGVHAGTDVPAAGTNMWQ